MSEIEPALCPQLANARWNFDLGTGKLENRLAGNGSYCLDSAGDNGTMAPCAIAAGWRATPIASSSDSEVQLESLTHVGKCLEMPAPVKPPPPPPPQYIASDPLRMRQTGNALMSYGSARFLGSVGVNSSESKGRGSMPIPVVVFTKGAAGLAFVQSPNDTLLAVAVDANSSGLELRRYNNKLGGVGAATVTFVVHLVPTAATDWRPSMAWVRSSFSRYFQPHTKELVADCKYSCSISHNPV